VFFRGILFQNVFSVDFRSKMCFFRGLSFQNVFPVDLSSKMCFFPWNFVPKCVFFSWKFVPKCGRSCRRLVNITSVIPPNLHSSSWRIKRRKRINSSLSWFFFHQRKNIFKWLNSWRIKSEAFLNPWVPLSFALNIAAHLVERCWAQLYKFLTFQTKDF
jgi:hypothetical protein